MTSPQPHFFIDQPANRRRISNFTVDNSLRERPHQLQSANADVKNGEINSGKALPELVLIRGLPGSGKSTMASELVKVGYRHFEADMYFELGGRYNYDARKIKEAHAWCQTRTREALLRGERVVVSNTFTRLSEMQPYYPMTRKIQVIEAKGNWDNTHGVPVEVVDRMRARWEPMHVPARPARRLPPNSIRI